MFSFFLATVRSSLGYDFTILHFVIQPLGQNLWFVRAPVTGLNLPNTNQDLATFKSKHDGSCWVYSPLLPGHCQSDPIKSLPHTSEEDGLAEFLSV